MYTIDLTPEELATLRLMVRIAVSNKMKVSIDSYSDALILISANYPDGTDDLKKDLLRALAKYTILQQELDTPLVLAAALGRKLIVNEQRMSDYTNLASSRYLNGAPDSKEIQDDLKAIVQHQANLIHKFKCAKLANMPTKQVLMS